MKKLLYIFVILSMIFPYSVFAATTSLKLGVIRIGGNNLSVGDAAKLAKFDRILANKFHHNDDPGGEATTWANIKATNANALIYLYQSALNVKDDVDCSSVTGEYTSYNDRYNVDCGHSMGDLNTDNSTLFMRRTTETRMVTSWAPTRWWLDFGEADMDDYACETLLTDNDASDWGADGIFSDHCFAELAGTPVAPLDYPDHATWNTAMNTFLSNMTACINTGGYLFGANRNGSELSYNKTAWQDLDDAANPPDLVLDERSFAIGSGGGDVYFYPAYKWLSSIETLSSIENSDVFTTSSTDLAEGASGTDNWGKSVDWIDILWFAIGSYLIAQTDKTYFYFRGDGLYSDSDPYWDEYTYLELGNPVGGYYVKAVDGINLYMRQYDLGYVIVNPQGSVSPSTATDLSNVDYSTDLGLSGTFREITHANMATSPLTDIEASTQFATFKSHRAKILYSGLVVYDVSPTDGGAGVSITSSATWNHIATVDDVEVWLDSGACDGTPDDAGADDLGDESSADADKTYDMSTLLENTAYCLTIVANAGAEQGEFQQFDFTTTTGPPAPPAGLATCSYHSLGLTGSYADQGATVGE